MILSVAVCTVLGIVIEKVAYKPLRKASPLAVLITAIGVSYLLQNIALLVFGAASKSFTSVVTLPPLMLAGGKLPVSGVTIVTGNCLCYHHGRLNAFYQKDKGRAGNARGIRG